MAIKKKATSRKTSKVDEPTREQSELESRPPDPGLRPERSEAPAPQFPVVKKAEGVRRALAAGLDSLDEIDSFLRTEFGIEMPRTMISSYKGQEKAKAARAAGGAPPGRKPVHSPSHSDGDIISDIETVKELIEKHGVDGIKRLVDVLS